MIVKQEDEQKALDAAAAVKSFLAHPAIQDRLTGVVKQIFAAWTQAKTVEEREALFARFRAFEDFQKELSIVEQYGTLAQHSRTQRVEQEERQAREAARRNPRNR